MSSSQPEIFFEILNIIWCIRYDSLWDCHMSSSQHEIYFEYLRNYKTLKIIRPPYEFFITWNIIYNYYITKLFSYDFDNTIWNFERPKYE